MGLNFALDDENRYRMTGYIDRLSRASDDTYQIHDYKTSAYLPSQEDVDSDQQLGLYQIGVQKRWPDIKNVKLIWHYLAFDRVQNLPTTNKSHSILLAISSLARPEVSATLSGKKLMSTGELPLNYCYRRGGKA